MNHDQLTELMNGKTVKIGKHKNQIFYDEDNNIFIVEMFEFTDSIGQNMFSVADGFENIETAILVATMYTCDTFNFEVHERLLKAK